MKKTIWELMGFSSEDEKIEIVFSEVSTVDGVVLSYEGDFVVGTLLTVSAEDGTMMPAPAGPHQVDVEGVIKMIELDELGAILSIEDVVEEPMAEETNTTEEVMSQVAEVLKVSLEDINARFTALENELKTLKEIKESKFKNETKKVTEEKHLSTSEILKNK